MARPKAGEVNKSQVVRDYITKHKSAKAADVIKALAEQGIEVHSSLVYNVLGKNRTKRGRVKTSAGPKTGRGAKTQSGNGQVTLDTLLAAKKLIAESGGIEAAKEALSVLERLAD